MTLPANDEILDQFSTRRDRFLNSDRIQTWRAELKENYMAVAGHQWTTEDAKERQRKNKPITVVNKTAPIVRAVAGYEIMNRTELNVQPRMTSTQLQEQSADVMNDAVEYLQDDSDFYFESAQASEDTLTCGLGATATSFDYTNPEAPAGEMQVDRIFPGFLMYDNQVRKKNLKGAKWAGYVEPVSREWLDDEMESLLGSDAPSRESGSQRDSEFLYFLDNITNDDLELLYYYEWCQNEKVYTFKNPVPIEIIQTDDLVAAMLEDVDASISVNVEDRTLVLDASEYRKYRATLKAIFEQGGIDFRPEIDASIGQRRKYYKARIARGVVLDASESWAADFTIQYKTGYYDERKGYYYGIVRAMLPVQRLMNESVSDYQSYLRSVPKGGMYMEEGATKDPKAFKKTRANEQEITMLANGGLQKILPKEVPQSPTALSEFVALSDQLLPGVIGLTPDFLGAVESGNMTSDLYGRLVKQAYMVLAHFFESNRTYMRRMGKLFIDGVRILSENYDGMVLRRISAGKADDAYFELSNDKLVKEYDVVIVERPKSEDEQQEEWNKLAQLAGMLQGKGVDITPLLIDRWPHELEDKQAIQKMMVPPPPPPPDPIQQALIEAETQNKLAAAKESAADSQLKRAKAMRELSLIEQGKEPKEKPDYDAALKLADMQHKHQMDKDKLLIDVEKLRLERDKVQIQAASSNKAESPIAFKLGDNDFNELPALLAEAVRGSMTETMGDIGNVLADRDDSVSGMLQQSIERITDAAKPDYNAITTALTGTMDGLTEQLDKISKGNNALADMMQRQSLEDAKRDNQLSASIDELITSLSSKPEEPKEKEKRRKIKAIYNDDGDVVGAEFVDELDDAE